GMAEIVSLPKILGTYGGGLVLLPKGEMADRLRPLTRNFSNFNASQGFLRWKETTPSATVTPTWDHLEFQNFAPDATVLKSIREGVAFWDARAETIQGRLAHVAKHRPDLLHASPFTPHEGRLPCVLPIPRSSLLGGECGLSVRRMNCSGDAAREDFHPMVLLPLHSGFSEHAFLEAASRLAI
ncbi:MAG: hypothetical protein LWX11_11415, partial [Firmicutes bacterium]|nr:hypothetical protein [Bacillota bacterium]